jgi:hypothetical protein
MFQEEVRVPKISKTFMEVRSLQRDKGEGAQ